MTLYLNPDGKFPTQDGAPIHFRTADGADSIEDCCCDEDPPYCLVVKEYECRTIVGRYDHSGVRWDVSVSPTLHCAGRGYMAASQTLLAGDYYVVLADGVWTTDITHCSSSPYTCWYSKVRMRTGSGYSTSTVLDFGAYTTKQLALAAAQGKFRDTFTLGVDGVARFWVHSYTCGNNESWTESEIQTDDPLMIAFYRVTRWRWRHFYANPGTCSDGVGPTPSQPTTHPNWPEDGCDSWVQTDSRANPVEATDPFIGWEEF